LHIVHVNARCQDRLVSAKHPQTLITKSNFAETLHAQGDLAQAASLDGAVLDAQEQLLGAELPQILAAKNYLALTLQAQSDLHGPPGGSSDCTTATSGIISLAAKKRTMATS